MHWTCTYILYRSISHLLITYIYIPWCFCPLSYVTIYMWLLWPDKQYISELLVNVLIFSGLWHIWTTIQDHAIQSIEQVSKLLLLIFFDKELMVVKYIWVPCMHLESYSLKSSSSINSSPLWFCCDLRDDP